MALNEAYDLHYRTYSTQVEVVKESIHYHLFYKSPVWKSFKDDEKNLFDNFIHLTNSLFYNFQTFTELEKCLFSYKFKKHKIGKTSISYIENFKRFLMNISLKNKKIKETVENILFESNSQWLKRYVYLIVKKIKKHYHQTNQIVSQINPTILLDKESYNLYSENGKNYIEITSLIFRKRIKIELSGYKGSLPKAKNRTSNICVSFNPIEAQFYVHFTFEDKKAQNKKENINTKKDDESFLGADYGESELLTLSDKKVIGNEQGKLLRQIIKETQKALKSVQLGTVDDLFFGIERKNTGRRNNKNNAFNHHKGKENINHHYRHHQQKINRRTEQYLLKCLHELEAHCKKNHISELVVEKLNFSQLGKNKIQRATINLIKGFYGLVNKKSFIKLTHVNPAKLFTLHKPVLAVVTLTRKTAQVIVFVVWNVITFQM